MTNKRLAAIRARADMAAGYKFAATNDENADWECPLCGGVGEVEGREYEHKELAGSVIAYGIDKGLKLCEEWVEFGPSDTLDLLDEVERLRSALRLLWEEATDEGRCQFEYAPGCYGHHISTPCRDAVAAALKEGE